MSVLKEIEKSPLSSKKFIAYFAASLTIKALLCFMIVHSVGPAILMWTVTCLTCIDLLYLGGTTALDIFVRLAHIKSIGKTEDKPEP